MEHSHQPICYIIAGPDGAGKTTFALKYLPLIVSCNDFINADEIAKGISPLNFDSGLLQASKIFLDTMNQKISAQKDFAFETTLSGRGYISKIKKWREAGWKVCLIYLYIPSIQVSAARVQQRVLQGGHNIPQTDIVRRYPRSIRNLFDYSEICDHTICFDNSKTQIKPIFEKYIDCPVKIINDDLFSILRSFYNYE